MADPSVLPVATAARLIGATSTSLRKPNSRSQTTETPDMNDVISTVMPMMPG